MTVYHIGEKVSNLKAELLRDLERSSLADWTTLKSTSETVLSDAIAAGDDSISNCAWFLDKIVETRVGFVQSFYDIKKPKFYDAWCRLERVEISLSSFERNPFFDPAEFKVYELANLVSNWQKLFPYKFFASPELVTRFKERSICGERIDPWSNCVHEAGQVYGGRECYRIVRDAEAISISIVTNPAQKYSVLFIPNKDGTQGDHHDYSILKFVSDRISAPFDGWSADWMEAYHPHELFTGRGEEDGCPCDSESVTSTVVFHGPASADLTCRLCLRSRHDAHFRMPRL